MSYGIFLLLFLGVPLVIAGVAFRELIGREVVLTLLAISLVALAYTAPWDNLIVVNGVWSYAPHQILGLIIGHVPIEEYAFYVLQVFLTGIWTLALLRRLR